MPRLQHAVAVAGLFALGSLVLSGCGAGAPPAPGAPGAASCAERTNRARSDVLAVVEQHRACSSDADCVSVGVGSACFDACSRAVSASGVQAVRDAAAEADRTTCAGFKQDGCRFDVPPCAPPMAPRCRQGACE